MFPKEAPAAHGWAGCQGWQSEKCAGNKRRVFAYRFFSSTSWVSQMTSHPHFVLTHFPLQGWEWRMLSGLKYTLKLDTFVCSYTTGISSFFNAVNNCF